MKTTFSKFLNLSSLAFATVIPLATLGMNNAFANSVISNNIIVNGSNGSVSITSYNEINTNVNNDEESSEQKKYDIGQLEFLKTLRNLFIPFDYISLNRSLKNEVLNNIQFYLQENSGVEFNAGDRNVFQIGLEDKKNPENINLKNIMLRLFILKSDINNGHVLIDEKKNKELVLEIDKAIDKYTLLYLTKFYEEHQIKNITQSELNLHKKLKDLDTSAQLDYFPYQVKQLEFLKNVRKGYEPFNYLGLPKNVIDSVNNDIELFAKDTNTAIYSQSDIDYINQTLKNKFITQEEKLKTIQKIESDSNKYQLFSGSDTKYELQAITNLRLYRLQNHIQDLNEKDIFSSPNIDFYKITIEAISSSTKEITTSVKMNKLTNNGESNVNTNHLSKEKSELVNLEKNDTDFSYLNLIIASALLVPTVISATWIISQRKKINHLKEKLSYQTNNQIVSEADNEITIVNKKIKF